MTAFIVSLLIFYALVFASARIDKRFDSQMREHKERLK